MVENKARIRQDIFSILKGFGGKEGVVGWMFKRLGRVRFEREEGGIGSAQNTGKWAEDAGEGNEVVVMKDEEILDAAVEAGVTDLDVGEEDIVTWTEPQELSQVAEKLETGFGARRQSMELVWEPSEEVRLEEKGLEMVRSLVGRLEEEAGVVGVFVNVALEER